MKKNLVLFLILLFVVVTALSVWGAGTATVTNTCENPMSGDVCQVTWSWTGDNFSQASTPVTGSVCMATTNPAGSPTDNYDIVINDSDGIDIFGGELANRDTTNSEQAVPKVGNGYGCRHVTGALTAVTTNQSVTTATGTIKLDVWKDRY